MFTYTLRRLMFAVPTLFVISFIIFALLDLAPNDPTGNLPLTIPPEVRGENSAFAWARRATAYSLLQVAPTVLLE